MRQSQNSVLPKSSRGRNIADSLLPLAIGGAAALVVSGFMMVSTVPLHTTHQPNPVIRVHGAQP